MSSSAADAIRNVKTARSASGQKASQPVGSKKRTRRSRRSGGRARLSTRFYVALFVFLAGTAGFVGVLTSIFEL